MKLEPTTALEPGDAMHVRTSWYIDNIHFKSGIYWGRGTEGIELSISLAHEIAHRRLGHRGGIKIQGRLTREIEAWALALIWLQHTPEARKAGQDAYSRYINHAQARGVDTSAFEAIASRVFGEVK